MPSKHIEQRTWKKVQDATVKAVIQTKVSIKETEMLKLLILKGLSTITEEEIQEFADKKSKEI
ncbi:hypothetical protein OQ486_16210 [Plesiomonas shigelloides]|uniref:hypothetical protein n=1 Tax=Plesiomonas shigelloides TaxID=703 RepID=UPI002246F76A|nr:hypothetical protein [Plesiomonas shigelloides]MCX2534989.1 hypothetical protein [Plesiomonas shigelloides]